MYRAAYFPFIGLREESDFTCSLIQHMNQNKALTNSESLTDYYDDHYTAYLTNRLMITASELTYTQQTIQTYLHYSFDCSYLKELLGFFTIIVSFKSINIYQ